MLSSFQQCYVRVGSQMVIVQSNKSENKNFTSYLKAEFYILPYFDVNLTKLLNGTL